MKRHSAQGRFHHIGATICMCLVRIWKANNTLVHTAQRIHCRVLKCHVPRGRNLAMLGGDCMVSWTRSPFHNGILCFSGHGYEYIDFWLGHFLHAILAALGKNFGLIIARLSRT